jgi:hypothetical protein
MVFDKMPVRVTDFRIERKLPPREPGLNSPCIHLTKYFAESMYIAFDPGDSSAFATTSSA